MSDSPIFAAFDFVCGNCAHYHPLPPDPNNIGVRAGECREQLHCVAVPNPATRSFDIMATYPQVPEKFPACSRAILINPNAVNASAPSSSSSPSLKLFVEDDEAPETASPSGPTP